MDDQEYPKAKWCFKCKCYQEVEPIVDTLNEYSDVKGHVILGERHG